MAFERLLSALDPDPGRAALAYEQLRHRLIGLLRWWGGSNVEELADATFDRVARKLEEGTAIQKGSLGAYFRGVARMIFYESVRQPRPQSSEIEPVAPSSPENGEAAAVCLDHCLATLAPGERELVLRYYGDGKHASVRSRLADEMGISPTALRIRTHRLRERLESCVLSCMERQ